MSSNHLLLSTCRIVIPLLAVPLARMVPACLRWPSRARALRPPNTPTPTWLHGSRPRTRRPPTWRMRATPRRASIISHLGERDTDCESRNSTRRTILFTELVMESNEIQIATLLVLPFAGEALLIRAAAATGDGAGGPCTPSCWL